MNHYLQTDYTFAPLKREAALKLAKHLGKELYDSSQETYTIAEVYNEPVEEKSFSQKRTIGFITEEV